MNDPFFQVVPDGKVPSVIYYARDGSPQAFGAETDIEDVKLEAEEQAWTRTEWWKLHLRPGHLPMIKDFESSPLPENVTLDGVFSDYLEYIRDQVQECISCSYAEGATLWHSLYPTMFVVLTTPNGWEGRQQERMRQAAIKAGFVDPMGGRRVRFVSEAEVCYQINSSEKI
jgi:hypothetical protein